MASGLSYNQTPSIKIILISEICNLGIKLNIILIIFKFQEISAVVKNIGLKLGTHGLEFWFCSLLAL